MILLTSVTIAVAEDASCLSSPTRQCLLIMAAETNVKASSPVPGGDTRADASDRSLVVGETWGRIFKAAAKTGEPDFVLPYAPAAVKQFGTTGIPELIAALKLAGRNADLAALLKQLEMDDDIADTVFGPALIAAGRSDEFKAFAASRRYEPYNVVAMEAAGNFLAGKPTEGLALIDALHGTFRKAAGVNTLAILQGTGHGDIAAPLVQYQDLATVNGVEACALVAQATKDKPLAEKCLAAASPLSEAAARDGAYLYAVAPQLVGALAAVGDWQEALTILRQLEPADRRTATAKLAKFSHAPEILPQARKVLGSPGPEARKRGGFLVRMLVLAGQADEAARFVATAPDDATRDDWSRLQVEALAEMGDTATALPLATHIADAASRAHALCATAMALSN
jgi:hypothetical protein